MTDLPGTIVEAGVWLRNGRISAVRLTDTLLTRAEQAQHTLATYVTITRESALAAAERADAELRDGNDRGPLHGIPIGVKDLLATSDAPTTACSRVLDPAWGQRKDASVIRKLRAAGAIVSGKLALNEFAIGSPDPATGFPIPRNPWDLDRTPGGSSSGTGAAIAAGLILGGLGSDTGGSIRGPASLCGISGIKPTFGRVSKEGCVPLSYSLDHVGPMARTARDCALMLQVMAGFDAADPCTAARDVPDMTAGLDGSCEGIRIGVPRAYFFDVPDLKDEVKQAVLEAIQTLRAAGAQVVDVSLPHAEVARSTQRVIMTGEAFAYHEPDMLARPELYGQWTRQSIRQGAFYSAADYVQAQRVRSIIKAEVDAVFEDVDVLITATSFSVATRFDEFSFEGSLRQPTFMAIWNVTGSPAMSIPCGFSSEGLPIGMQIVGRPFDEPTVLKVGDAYQTLTDWHQRVPTPIWEAQPA
jgi:aspartyl-tRNA(Asn)/glutamyl-tRNA(Gln) amidotransferase subunit A